MAEVVATADRYDAVVVVTDHDTYSDPDSADFGDAVVDARNTLGTVPLPAYAVGAGHVSGDVS